MKQFEGVDITSDYVDDLVEEWHTNDMPTSLDIFIKSNTGWTDGEYETWALTGAMPI